MHPLYKKFIRRSKRYHAHDEGNTLKIGDAVKIRGADRSPSARSGRSSPETPKARSCERYRKKR